MSLQYRFPNGARLEIDTSAFNTHNQIVRAYIGKKEFSLPIWLIDGLRQALSYTSMGSLCLVHTRLPKEVRSTLPTKVHTTGGERVNVSAGGLI